jgi:hypothetical protein
MVIKNQLQEASTLLSLAELSKIEFLFLAVITTQKQDSMTHGFSITKNCAGNALKEIKTTLPTKAQQLVVLAQELMLQLFSMRIKSISLVVMEELISQEFPLMICFHLIFRQISGKKSFQIQTHLCQMVVADIACLHSKIKSTFMVDGIMNSNTTISGNST